MSSPSSFLLPPLSFQAWLYLQTKVAGTPLPMGHTKHWIANTRRFYATGPQYSKALPIYHHATFHLSAMSSRLWGPTHLGDGEGGACHRGSGSGLHASPDHLCVQQMAQVAVLWPIFLRIVGGCPCRFQHWSKNPLQHRFMTLRYLLFQLQYPPLQRLSIQFLTKHTIIEIFPTLHPMIFAFCHPCLKYMKLFLLGVLQRYVFCNTKVLFPLISISISCSSAKKTRKRKLAVWQAEKEQDVLGDTHQPY